MNTKRKTGQSCTGSISNSKVAKLPYKKPFAVKELERLAFEEKVRKYPGTPVEWLEQPKYRDDSANGLTRCIIDYIRLNGGQAERINNTGRMIDMRQSFTDVIGRSRTIGQTKWIKSNGQIGTADISATINGLSVKIEVKHGRDVQSAAQRAYQSQVQQAGGIYVIATSFEQFYNWYNLKFEIDGR